MSFSIFRRQSRFSGIVLMPRPMARRVWRVEAMTYGRPVVATSCGGPAELIEDEVTGLLVPNRHVGAMAEAIVRIAGDPLLRKELGNRAREAIRSKLAPDATYLALREVYESLHVRI
jgi:L-malate glycosyltransferase